MNKTILLWILAFVNIFPIVSQEKASPQLLTRYYKDPDCRNWVDSVYNTLSLEERIGQLFMMVVSPDGSERSEQQIERYVTQYKVGGIYFSKGDAMDHATATNWAQALAKVPLLVGMDGEWGLAMRLSNTVRYPRNMMLGAIRQDSLIYAYGEEMGKSCRTLGVHINFAPVADVNNNPDNPVIGTRSFGEDPQEVARRATLYMKGLQSQQVIAVAKHFPGHGDTQIDSHKALPVINHDLERLEQIELFPFRQLVKEGIDGVMVGHLYVPSLDEATKLPSSLSPSVINGWLKDKLDFKGLVFTDALVMKGVAAANSVAVKAIVAGNDVLLSPNRLEQEINQVKQALASAQITRTMLEEKVMKILTYKYLVGLNHYKPVDLVDLYERLNPKSATDLNLSLHIGATTLLKNQDETLPLHDLQKYPVASLALGDTDDTPFQLHLDRYMAMPRFSLPVNASADRLREANESLKDYPQLVISIHSVKQKETAFLKALCKTHRVTLVFFTSPYHLREFKESIADARAVVVGYENTDCAQQVVAEGVFGGIAMQGALPVAIAPLFKKGEGLKTEKCRISYFNRDTTINTRQLAKEVEDIVQEGLDNKAFPGCQVMVLKNGSVIYEKAFGRMSYDSGEPVLNTTLYDLASLTKTTATLPAVMKLYDQKKLDLNARLDAYLPKAKGSDKASLKMTELLYHQSGLVAFIPFYRSLIDEESFSGSLFSSNESEWYSIPFDGNTFVNNQFKLKKGVVSDSMTSRHTLQMAEGVWLDQHFKEDVMQQILDSPLRKRGRYVYSDLNFILLKEVVDQITRQPFDKYIRESLFVPLGANLMGFHPLERADKQQIAPTVDDQFLRKQLLRGYPHDEAAAVLGGVAGNAGLFSNANDIAKYLQMLLNEGIYGKERILSAETVRLFVQSKSKVSRRGLGFDKSNGDNPNSSPVCEAASVTSDVYGHTGFTGTCYWVDPHEQLIFIFLSNRVHPDRGNSLLSTLRTRWRIHEAIYRSFQQ